MDLGNGLLSNDTSFKANTILSSNSLKEYNYKIKANEEINGLKRENKSLADEINSLKGKNKSLAYENKRLYEKLKKSKGKNREILSSKSWKITEPIRRIKGIIRKF